MSVKVTGWVWDQPLPTSEKIVLLKLADHAHHDGSNVYPSVAEIARDTGLSERQVQRYLSAFVRRGVLAIDGNAAGGRGKTRVYRFTFQKGDTDDADSRTAKGVTDVTQSEPETVPPTSPFAPERVTPEAQKGDTGDAKRVTPVTEKGDIHARANQNRPEPSLEPSRTTARVEPATARESFEQFRTAYPPGHLHQQPAWEAWRRLDPDPELVELILHGLELWKASDQWQRGYVSRAHNWLRDALWEDDPPPAPRDLEGLNPITPTHGTNGRRGGYSAQELVDMAKRGERSR